MKAKQIILFAPPGIDASAYGVSLAQRWRVPHISMDSLLRSAGLGAEEPVSDDLAMKLLRRRFEQPDAMLQGWVLTGFPRTLTQARRLDEFLAAVGLPAAHVAHLQASTGLLLSRLCAEPHEPVSAVRRRLADHRAAAAPLLDYYQVRSHLTKINASLSGAEIIQALYQLGQEDSGAAPLIQDEAELDSLLADEPALVVDCMASWCGSCKQVAPLIDRLASTYGDRVKVMKIDFDANRQIPKRFGLKGMPAVMFFKHGQLQTTLTGVKSYQAYSEAVTEHLDPVGKSTPVGAVESHAAR